MTTIIYEYGYLRITQAGREIGFRMDDLKPNDRYAFQLAAADMTHAKSTPKKPADPGLEELAKRMGITI